MGDCPLGKATCMLPNEARRKSLNLPNNFRAFGSRSGMVSSSLLLSVVSENDSVLTRQWPFSHRPSFAEDGGCSGSVKLSHRRVLHRLRTSADRSWLLGHQARSWNRTLLRVHSVGDPETSVVGEPQSLTPTTIASLASETLTQADNVYVVFGESPLTIWRTPSRPGPNRSSNLEVPVRVFRFLQKYYSPNHSLSRAWPVKRLFSPSLQ